MTLATGNTDLVRLRLIVALMLEIAALVRALVAKAKAGKKVPKRSPGVATIEADLERLIATLERLERTK